MNKDRRKRLQEVIDKLHPIHAELEELVSEEQDAFDSMPDSFQNAEKGETMQAGIDALQEAANMVTGAIEQIEEATNG